MKSCLFSLLFVCSVFSLPLKSGTISINTSPGTASVSVANVTDLFAFEFDLTFDPQAIQIIQISEGTFLPAGGSTLFLPGSINNTNGSVIGTADVLSGAVPGLSGGGVLATVSFEALLPDAGFTLSNVNLLNSSLEIIPINSTTGTVPEPSTLLAMLLGACVVFNHRRARIISAVTMFILLSSHAKADGVDVNNDGAVDVRDMAIVSRCLNQSPALPACSAADLNGDGVINKGDLGKVAVSLGIPSNETIKEKVHRLALELTATDRDTRTRGILHVVTEIGIGVYTGDGQPLISGYERGLGDFYLYNNELPLLEMIVADSSSLAYGQLLASLPLDIFSDEASAIQQFDQALTEAASDAVNAPDVTNNFTVLLVRELGLLSPTPYDLAVKHSTEISFSHTQRWLFNLELVLGSLAHTPAPLESDYQAADQQPTSHRVSPLSTPPAQLNVVASLPPIIDSTLKDKVGKLLEKLTGLPKSIMGPVVISAKTGAWVAKQSIAALHNMLVQFLTSVTGVPDPIIVEEGSGAQTIGFLITVPEENWKVYQRFLSDNNQYPFLHAYVALSAGPLSGAKFPTGPGPVSMENININLTELVQYGATTDCENGGGDCTKTTDEDGIARVKVTPEKGYPDIPRRTSEERGHITALVNSFHSTNASLLETFKDVSTPVPFTLIRYKAPLASVVMYGSVHAAQDLTGAGDYDDPTSSSHTSGKSWTDTFYTFTQEGDASILDDSAVTGSVYYLFKGTFVFTTRMQSAVDNTTTIQTQCQSDTGSGFYNATITDRYLYQSQSGLQRNRFEGGISIVHDVKTDSYTFSPRIQNTFQGLVTLKFIESDHLSGGCSSVDNQRSSSLAVTVRPYWSDFTVGSPRANRTPPLDEAYLLAPLDGMNRFHFQPTITYEYTFHIELLPDGGN